MRPFLVGIAGGSGSGKSWLARQVLERFPDDSLLVSVDWYYRDLSNLPRSEAARTNFDHPNAIDFDLLLEQLDELLAGRKVKAPDYLFSRFRRKTDARLLTPKPLILVEGLFALCHRPLASRCSHTVYVDTPADLRLIRRIRRDLRERGYPLKKILASWETYAHPMHEQFVEPSAGQADRVWRSVEDTAFVPQFLVDLQEQLARNEQRDEAS